MSAAGSTAAPPPIDVPVPSLVVLIGAAGAGKTTLVARVFEPAEILSSDILRAAITGDPADQRATRPAFAILHREASRRLAAGRLVVVDATNVEPSARWSLRRLAAIAAVPTIAIVIAAPGAEVHARNAGRTGRVVPADVVERHLARLDGLGRDRPAIRATLLAEGFDAVHVLASTDELDAVSIRRIAAPPGAAGPPDRA